MATADSLERRRMIANSASERRARGLARVMGISIPPQPVRRYPDMLHRQADVDERIAAILTELLRKADPKAKELIDPPQGVINEYRKDTDMPETNQSHSGDEPREMKKGESAFKTIEYGPDGGASPVTKDTATGKAVQQTQAQPSQTKAAKQSDDDDDSPVSDTNADEAIATVQKMRSRDRLQHVADNDKRKSVQDAARKRLVELG